MDNNKAQALELVYDIERALEIVDRLLARGPARGELPVAVQPAGRHRHGHYRGAARAADSQLQLTTTQGRITAADVITPTAFNAASVEDHLRLDRRAERSDSDEPALTKKLEMIVRAYDPCISCSVHLFEKRMRLSLISGRVPEGEAHLPLPGGSGDRRAGHLGGRLVHRQLDHHDAGAPRAWTT